MENIIFAPNGHLLTEIMSGGTIITYHIVPDFFSNSINLRIGHILLELHKDRKDYNRQKTLHGDMFLPKYVAYQCMNVNGEWTWLPMTYYRTTRVEAIKGLREQYREDIRSKRIESQNN
jgi:UDP-2,3-diacylglucosamine pyrophosphatase LpxH